MATVCGHFRVKYDQPTRDLGEHESIALLIHELTDAVLVVLDRRAAMLALAELGPGRVVSPFDFWHWLRAEDIIDQAAFEKLCTEVLRKDQGFPGLPVRFRTG